VGEDGAFAFDGVCCGTHYLGVWKDNNAGGVICSGDYWIDRSNPERCCVRKDAVDYHSMILVVVP